MTRRKLILILAGTLAVPGLVATLAGCHNGNKPPESTPTPPPTPVPEVSPTPEESASPEVEPSETPPAEPPAPYGELTPGQQDRLNTVMDTLSEVNADEARRWIENLSYDETGTEHELRKWEAIADAYHRFTEEHTDLSEDGKRDTFHVLMMRSLLPEAEALRYVKLAALTPDEAREAMGMLALPDASPSAHPL